MAQRQKEHASSVLPFVARVWHQPSHASTAVSATWEVAHGFAISLQKEHAWHLQSAQCSAALAGLQNCWHAGKGVSPYAGVDPGAKTHCSPAAAGGGGDVIATQKAQPRQRHIWQCDSALALEHTPGAQPSDEASPTMPESHGSPAYPWQKSHPWQRHSPHISRDAAFAASSGAPSCPRCQPPPVSARPVIAASARLPGVSWQSGWHSTHLVSPFLPDEHGWKLSHQPQPLHLHSSQCFPLFSIEQNAWHSALSVSFSFAGVHAPSGPTCSFGFAAETEPSCSQNGQLRHMHSGQKSAARRASHTP